MPSSFTHHVSKSLPRHGALHARIGEYVINPIKMTRKLYIALAVAIVWSAGNASAQSTPGYLPAHHSLPVTSGHASAADGNGVVVGPPIEYPDIKVIPLEDNQQTSVCANSAPLISSCKSSHAAVAPRK